MSWERTPEKKSLQTTPKNRHIRCGRDVLGQTVQTVPGTSSSNRKGPVANGGLDSRVRRTFSVSEEEERRRLGVSGSRNRRNQPCTPARRRDTAVLSRADTCTQVHSTHGLSAEFRVCSETKTLLRTPRRLPLPAA